MRARIALVAVAAAACATVRDVTPLSATVELAHVAAATDRDLVVADLYDGDVPLARAPDPSALLDALAAANPAPAVDAARLVVATFNVGLLDSRPLLPGLPRFRSPHVDARRRALPKLVVAQGWDVVLLQEVWTKQDVRRFVAAADAAGYDAHVGPRDEGNDGLVVLVKRAIVDAGAPSRRWALRYGAQEPLEWLLGPKIGRGALAWSFRHRTIGDVVVWNTHLQSFATYWRERHAQLRELARATADHGDALVLVGGDLNAGPYYRLPTWTQTDGDVVDAWWQNALAWPLLLREARLVDLVVRGRGARARDDVTWGARVERPLPATFCADAPVDVFTAGDCNGLYRAQYGGDEPPARLDHLLARDPRGRVHVAASGLALHAPGRFGDVVVEPSDHAAVVVDLRVAPAAVAPRAASSRGASLLRRAGSRRVAGSAATALSSPPMDDAALLDLAARLWAERRGAAPPDEATALRDVEDDAPRVRNPVVDAIDRCGYARFAAAVARVRAGEEAR